jgi:transcriptional regulator with XRE-family HTH domain
MYANQMGLGSVLDRNRLQQKHVAEALGVTRMTVWQWVHGRARPTGINVIRLMDYLRKFEPGLAAEAVFPAEPVNGSPGDGERDAQTEGVEADFPAPAESKR